MAESSAFSFHCMICFEEFHPTERYPVVLPCGHTYVCHVCADRLDKCMECRTPLAWTIPSVSKATHSPGTQSSRSSWSNARSSTRRYPASRYEDASISQPRLSPPEKRRLPLPKNVVLLSMLEATEIATERARHPPRTPETSPSSHSEESKGEDEKIKAGFSIAVGACGTYVVVAKDGLQIYPSRPTAPTDSEVDRKEQDVDSLVRFFHLDHKLDVHSEDETDLKKSSSKELPPLACGDRVQIVTVDGNWAKLARGYGFVRSVDNSLVKVGGSVDRACKLEAMLSELSIRRRELRKQQSIVDNQFVRLMTDLQSSLCNDEDLTVIPADTFGEADSELSRSRHAQENEDQEEKTDNDDSIALQKPIPFHRVETPPLPSSSSPFSCLDSGQLPALPPATQGTSPTEPFIPRARLESQPSPRALSAGARAWREQHGRQASRSTDFRTGMSGHMGLVSSHAHPHDYLKPDRAFGSLRMSSHSGLTVPRRRRPHSPRSPNSLSVPTFSFPPYSYSEGEESGA